MCVNPYIAKRKDGSPVAVPCGHCLECRKAYQREWQFRLNHELKRCDVPIYLTLTYKDNCMPYGDTEDGRSCGCVDVRDVQKFLKRLRKNGGELFDGLRYFCVAEYGTQGTIRPHYHMVLIAPNVTSVNQVRKLVQKSWKLGFEKTKFCTKDKIHYLTKYLNKIDERNHLVKPFRLYSRSLGLNYLTPNVIKFYLTSFDRTCLLNGYRMGLPRYYVRKLDELSTQEPMMKKAGLCYSDLREEIIPMKDTRWWYMKEFNDHFYEIAERMTPMMDCGYYQQPLLHLSLQDIWVRYRESIPLLHNLYEEDCRRYKDALVKNKIRDVDIGVETDEILQIIYD